MSHGGSEGTVRIYIRNQRIELLSRSEPIKSGTIRRCLQGQGSCHERHCREGDGKFSAGVKDPESTKFRVWETLRCQPDHAILQILKLSQRNILLIISQVEFIAHKKQIHVFSLSSRAWKSKIKESLLTQLSLACRCQLLTVSSCGLPELGIFRYLSTCIFNQCLYKKHTLT